MASADKIIERLRDCVTVGEVDALAKKHAGDILRMSRDPDLRVRVIHIKNLAAIMRKRLRDD